MEQVMNLNSFNYLDLIDNISKKDNIFVDNLFYSQNKIKIHKRDIIDNFQVYKILENDTLKHFEILLIIKKKKGKKRYYLKKINLKNE